MCVCVCDCAFVVSQGYCPPFIVHQPLPPQHPPFLLPPPEQSGGPPRRRGDWKRFHDENHKGMYPGCEIRRSPAVGEIKAYWFGVLPAGQVDGQGRRTRRIVFGSDGPRPEEVASAQIELWLAQNVLGLMCVSRWY